MSALSTHHNRTKREKKQRRTRKQERTWTSDKSSKEARTSHLTKQRSIPSDKGNGSTQSTKTQAWLLKDRGSARHSHARSGRKNRNSMHFPLTSATLTTCMHSQSPVHNKFLEKSNNFPLVRSLTSPPCWHVHTSSLKRPKAPPEAETPPEQMLCNECNAGGVSESIQEYKDMSHN